MDLALVTLALLAVAALRPETPAPLEPASGSRTETVKCELCGGENCLLAFCSSDKCIRNAVVAQAISRTCF